MASAMRSGGINVKQQRMAEKAASKHRHHRQRLALSLKRARHLAPISRRSAYVSHQHINKHLA